MLIPSDIPAGDYLLRAEVIALHVAGSLEGAQFYISCCMFLTLISVTHLLLTDGAYRPTHGHGWGVS